MSQFPPTGVCCVWGYFVYITLVPFGRMKNITLFYCKQTSVLLNTKRKGYKISQSLLSTTTTTLCSQLWMMRSPHPIRVHRGVGKVSLGLQVCRMLQITALHSVGGLCMLCECCLSVFRHELGWACVFYLPFAANNSHFYFLFNFFFFLMCFTSWQATLSESLGPSFMLTAAEPGIFVGGMTYCLAEQAEQGLSSVHV